MFCRWVGWAIVALFWIAPAMAQEKTSPALPIAPVTKPQSAEITTLRLFNKLTGVNAVLSGPADAVLSFERMRVRVQHCQQSEPWAMVQEIGAFVQIDVGQRGQAAARRVFSGWLFKNAPSLSPFDHPTYDVRVISCTTSSPQSAGPTPKPAP